MSKSKTPRVRWKYRHKTGDNASITIAGSDIEERAVASILRVVNLFDAPAVDPKVRDHKAAE